MNSLIQRLLSVLLLACFVAPVFGLAGELKTPGIAIPVVEKEGEKTHDPVARQLQNVLSQEKWKFAGGHFVNAHTTLRYSGAAADLTAFLAAIAEVDGAGLTIRFSSEALEKGGQWSVQHNAWTNSSELVVTIHLGDGKIKLVELSLPRIVGRKPAKP